MPRTYRDIWSNQFEIISIIKDKQPTTFILEPLLHRLHQHCRVFQVLLRKLEQASNGLKTEDEALACLSLYPKHSMIVFAKAIGILSSRLRLSHARQTRNGLSRDSFYTTLYLKVSSELLQNGSTTCKKSIVASRNVPHFWKRRTKAVARMLPRGFRIAITRFCSSVLTLLVRSLLHQRLRFSLVDRSGHGWPGCSLRPDRWRRTWRACGKYLNNLANP